MARWLVILGVVLIVAGLLWPWLTKLGLGRLPGDIAIERDDFRVYIPITTSILISLVLSLVLWLLDRRSGAPRGAWIGLLASDWPYAMRIIAGEFRGRRLRTPKGQAIRPTSDRAREALFDILEHGTPTVRGARFLDLFSGTGAVGLEAHSRGASEVVLVENDRAALQLAQANLAQIGAPSGVRLLARDATRLGPAPHPFDLAFLDPPYRSGSARAALEGLLRDGWLGADVRIIVELAATDDLDLPGGYTLERERRYGSAKLLFLRRAK